MTARPKGPTAKRRQNKAQAKRRAYSIICRIVDARDGLCCRICTRFCDVAEHHHIVYRSRGGKDVPSNIVRVCSWCHAAIHDKRVLVTGTADNLNIQWKREVVRVAS